MRAPPATPATRGSAPWGISPGPTVYVVAPGETGGTPGERWYYLLVGFITILLAVLTFTGYFLT
jgi:hypothetical protein